MLQNFDQSTCQINIKVNFNKKYSHRKLAISPWKFIKMLLMWTKQFF